MRHYSIDDLTKTIDTAIAQLQQAKLLAQKGEVGAMAAAAAGALANEANAIGITGYKEAGRMAFRAIQTIMYTQKGHASGYNMDLKDSTDTCAQVFGNLESVGFLYPRFAKIGCPTQFTRYWAGVVDETGIPDANMPSAEATPYLLVTALKHGNFDQREALRATTAVQNPNPFEAIHSQIGASGPIVQLFTCDADGVDGLTATPGDGTGLGDITGGDIYGRAIVEVTGAPIYSFAAHSNAAVADYYIRDAQAIYGNTKAEAWHANEWWIALAIDPGASTKIDTGGAATQYVESGESLLIRTIADQQSDLGTPTAYNPST